MIKFTRLATTINNDTEKDIKTRVNEVFNIFLKENNLKIDSVKVIQISLTSDIKSYNPCKALREEQENLEACLFTSLEPNIKNSLKKAIRFLITLDVEESKEIKPIYMHEARNLRKEFAYPKEYV